MSKVFSLSLVALVLLGTSCALEKRCAGEGCDCKADSDCALTGLPTPIHSAADCHCPAVCDPTPLNQAEFVQTQKNWQQFCDNPDAGPVLACPAAKCGTLVTYQAACSLGTCVRVER